MSYNLSDLWTSMSWETKAAMGTGQRDDCSGQLLLFLLTKTPFNFPKIMQQIKQMYWENKYISQIRNKVHNWCHKCHGWRLIKSRKKTWVFYYDLLSQLWNYLPLYMPRIKQLLARNASRRKEFTIDVIIAMVDAWKELRKSSQSMS